MKQPEKYFSGKLIHGTELRCLCQGQIIELLGYEIDVNKMKKSICNVYPSETEVKNIQFKVFYES